MGAEPQPVLWVVAGCLFEVSLPAGDWGRWRWANPGQEVTLLGDGMREGAHHFRFRAEASGADAGVVELRFGSPEPGPVERTLLVGIAPEHFVIDDAERGPSSC